MAPIIVTIAIAVNHLIGLIGLNLPVTKELMVTLTPVNLLLTTMMVVLFSSTRNWRLLVFFLFAFLFGWTIELMGVRTELIFGSYSYTNVLGPAILDIPLMIGVNWFLLSYCIVSFLNRYAKLSVLVKVVFGALLMTCIDLLIEPFAVEFGLWEWYTLSSMPGIQNYVAWFFVSLIVFAMYYFLLKKETNKVAAFTFPILAVFFLLNYLWFTLL